LTGDGGFLPEMIKAVLERGLAAELTGHLGYETGDVGGRDGGNSRNGHTPKTVQTETGPLRLSVPRDRDSSFTPRLIPKGQRRLGGLDDQIISLYAGGMTVRDIQAHLHRTLGTELSHDTISKITDAVLEGVKAWQARPLEEVYPIVYLDALMVKVRDGHQVRNKAAHLAIGVTTEGIKQVPGDLGAEHRRREVLGRGLRRAGEPRGPRRPDRLLRRPDRPPGGDRGDLAGDHGADLRGAPDPRLDAIRVLRRPQGGSGGVAPDRHRGHGGRGGDRAADLHRVRSRDALPGCAKTWSDAWERFIPFLAFPPAVRKVIYTTNSIVHYQIRKVIKNRGHFPTDDAAVKLIWLAIMNVEDKRAAEREKERGAPRGTRKAPGRLVEGQTTHGLRRAHHPGRPGRQQHQQPAPTTLLHRKLDRLYRIEAYWLNRWSQHRAVRPRTVAR